MNLVAGAPVVTETEILTEAQNYDDMFTKLAKFVMLAKPSRSASYSSEEQAASDAAAWPPEKRTAYAQEHVTAYAKEEIQWARKTLKRNDRIVWYLRFIRLNIITNLMRVFEPEPFREMFDAEVKQFIAKSRNPEAHNEGHSGETVMHNEIERAAKNIPYLHRQLEHYMSYADKIAKINSYVFAWQPAFTVFDDLGHFEKQWRDERSGLIAIEEDDEDKPVIEFTDGFAWVLLDRASCEEEGEAMGHCGNRGSPSNGDRIMSLRRKVIIDSTVHWRPSLTFILHSDGMLGEMKGRGNDKPAAKYHRHIVSLLESDYVKGITGGGYMPENNFAMSDLDPELAETLMDKKPALATPLYYWTKNGVDDNLIKMLRERGFQRIVNRNYPSLIKFSEDGKTAYLAEFEDVTKFIEYYGDSDFGAIMDSMEGGNEVHGTEEPGEHGRQNVWEVIPDDVQHAIGLYLQEHNEDAIQQWCEDKGYERDEWSPTDEDDVLGVIEVLQDEWVDALDQAHYAGQEAGAQDEIFKTVNQELTGSWNLVGDMQGSLVYDEQAVERMGRKSGLVHDTKCYLATDSKSFLGYASGGADLDDFDGYMEEEIEVQQPYYGWQGFSDDQAVEYFKENSPDYRPFLKKSEEDKKAA